MIIEELRTNLRTLVDGLYLDITWYIGESTPKIQDNLNEILKVFPDGGCDSIPDSEFALNLYNPKYRKDIDRVSFYISWLIDNADSFEKTYIDYPEFITILNKLSCMLDIFKLNVINTQEEHKDMRPMMNDTQIRHLKLITEEIGRMIGNDSEKQKGYKLAQEYYNKYKDFTHLENNEGVQGRYELNMLEKLNTEADMYFLSNEITSADIKSDNNSTYTICPEDYFNEEVAKRGKAKNDIYYLPISNYHYHKIYANRQCGHFFKRDNTLYFKQQNYYYSSCDEAATIFVAYGIITKVVYECDNAILQIFDDYYNKELQHYTDKHNQTSYKPIDTEVFNKEHFQSEKELFAKSSKLFEYFFDDDNEKLKSIVSQYFEYIQSKCLSKIEESRTQDDSTDNSNEVTLPPKLNNNQAKDIINDMIEAEYFSINGNYWVWNKDKYNVNLQTYFCIMMSYEFKLSRISERVSWQPLAQLFNTKASTISDRRNGSPDYDNSNNTYTPTGYKDIKMIFDRHPRKKYKKIDRLMA